MKTVLSMGAGRQTIGMVCLMSLGELEWTDYIVMADTGDEKPETYAYIKEHLVPFLKRHGKELVIVAHQNETLYEHAYRYKVVPSILQRWCTDRFKITVINRWLRQQGATRKEPWQVWIGISKDEEKRARDRRPRLYAPKRWPLVEQGLTMRDCQRAILRAGLPLPEKSGCWYCPLQRIAGWRRLAVDHPELLDKAEALEDNALARNPRDFLRGPRRIKLIAAGGYQPSFGEEFFIDGEAACTSGYCHT